MIAVMIETRELIVIQGKSYTLYTHRRSDCKCSSGKTQALLFLWLSRQLPGEQKSSSGRVCLDQQGSLKAQGVYELEQGQEVNIVWIHTVELPCAKVLTGDSR
jgi:hypothetical protein